MINRVLDRVYRPDPRNWPLTNLILVPEVFPASRSYYRKVILDQGSTPGCVGFSQATWAATAPHGSGRMTDAIGTQVYQLAKFRDEYAGENYDGSSVLGGCEAALKDKQWSTSYYWARTADEILTALQIHSVIFGIDWYTGMFHPDSNGLIQISGQVEGGHAISGSAYRRDKNGTTLIRLDNSWGPGWGIKGSAFIMLDDIMQLMAAQGECAVPVKIRPFPRKERP